MNKIMKLYAKLYDSGSVFKTPDIVLVPIFYPSRNMSCHQIAECLTSF